MLRKLFGMLAVVGLASTLMVGVGCEDDSSPVERDLKKAGENIKDAAEEAKDETKDAADDVKDAVKDATN